jgi:hypothetical protein
MVVFPIIIDAIVFHIGVDRKKADLTNPLLPLEEFFEKNKNAPYWK